MTLQAFCVRETCWQRLIIEHTSYYYNNEGAAAWAWLKFDTARGAAAIN